MILHPVDRGLPVTVAVSAIGEVGGVSAQKIVERVPGGDVLDDQVRVGQLGQRWPYPSWGQAGEAGGRGCGDVRAGVQAEQPERPGRVGVQLRARRVRVPSCACP
jgi:hypothetical protein